MENILLIYNSSKDNALGKIITPSIDYSTFENPTTIPDNWRGINNYQKEYVLFSICEKINTMELEGIDCIIIPLTISPTDPLDNSAIELAHHIRLHQFTDSNKKEFPIIITHYEDLNINEYGKIKSHGIFSNNTGVTFKTFNEVYKLHKSSKLEKEINKQKRNFNYQAYLETIVIPTLTNDRHGITNHWGAYRLLKGYGYQENNIAYEPPNILFFKYLKRKFSFNNNTSTPSSIYTNKLKVLLIDDHSEKGWKKALEKILPATVNVKTSIADALSINQIDYKTYDLVFLDLYLPNADNQSPTDRNTKLFLQSLKKINPTIPIIIFTASNKAWNLKEFMDNGADGYFVKEGTELAPKENYSAENATNFKKNVEDCIKKRKLLFPFYEKIEVIKNASFLIQDTKIKDRIDERLMMFLGLLKKGAEQNTFNKTTFFYSDYELAFITLWSILNEIQEDLFDRNNSSFAFKLLDGTPVPSLLATVTNMDSEFYDWSFYGETYIKFLPYQKRNGDIPKKNSNTEYKLKMYSKLISIYDVSTKTYNSPYFKIESDFQEQRSKTYRETLGLQMAFIILTQEQKGKINASQRETLLENLVDLNEIRNKLYLTHGSDIASGFFLKTEKEKRNDASAPSITPQDDIKKLFELVYFLITEQFRLITFV